MAYSSAWIALCEDPYGEAMRPRLWVRLNDGVDGAPSTLVNLTAPHEILSINPVISRREVKFGVIEGQAWQVLLENADLGLFAYDLTNCWCALQAGFPDADVWELVAQGRIERVVKSTGATLMLEVHDAVMELLNSELKRDIRYCADGWASDIQSSSIAAGSDEYDNNASGAGVTILSAANLAHETYRIVFTSATAFDVIWEDGDTAGSGTTSADCDVSSVYDQVTDVVRIESAGWTGAYAGGDEFVFYTSEALGGSGDLAPVTVLQTLVGESGAYDVISGAAYTPAYYDSANWGAISALNDDYDIAGTWTKGTKKYELIQDILKIIHGSLYAARTGQAALWAVQPSTSVAATLNGTPGAGDVSILKGSLSDDQRDSCTSVAYEYLDVNGNDAVYTATAADSALHKERHVTVRVGWECPGPLIEPAANKYLSRFGAALETYELDTTLAGIAADIGNGIAITDAALGVAAARVDVTETELDILANSARLTAYIDPVIIEDYAVIGTATIDGTEVIW